MELAWQSPIKKGAQHIKQAIIVSRRLPRRYAPRNDRLGVCFA
jgi:hypothetical protein